MRSYSIPPRCFAAIFAAIVPFGVSFLLLSGCSSKEVVGKFPEQIVYVRTKDDMTDSGALFAASQASNKPIAIIWIHGWGVNFYQPSYVNIGRALANRGYTCISANTRMHDLGNVAGYRDGKRIRGGGYWGIASEEVHDLAAWIDFAGERGFKQVILVGHSAGWAAVRSYQVETQDPRVIGVVLASGAVRAETRPTDTNQLAEAMQFTAKGEGDALVRDPKRSFPSYISAATFLDIVKATPEMKDFFGTQSTNAAVTRLHCPLLAFFGTRGDVGTEADLETMKASIQRLPSGPSRVDTVMIRGADHMYAGEEEQVAQTIAKWADTLTPPEAGTDSNPK